MRILQTIAGMEARCGGTSTCTHDLMLAMSEAGCHVELLAPQADGMLGEGEPWLRTVPQDAVTPYKYTRAGARFLRESDYDIYHTNGLWLHINHATCAVAREKGRPYVITTHGMMESAALRRSAWKKWPMRKLWFDRDIMGATCIHATAVPELEAVRAFGYRGPVAVIPNPMSMPPYLDEVAAAKADLRGCNRPRKLGFLGRFHPRKKVDHLLAGVKLCPGVELLVMGSGTDGYEKYLRREAERLGVQDRVTFMGFVNGREKYEQLAQLDALMVPSVAENFGMIVTEALSVGTPVMASLGTPWQALNVERCGWWVANDVPTIASIMREIVAMPREELLAMGQRGRALVLRNYTGPRVAAMMGDLYKWIAGEAERPDFIYS